MRRERRTGDLLGSFTDRPFTELTGGHPVHVAVVVVAIPAIRVVPLEISPNNQDIRFTGSSQ